MKTLIRKSLQATGLYFSYLIFRERFFPSELQKQEQESIITRKNFYATFVSKNSLCFDVGANVGNRTSAFVELGAKVIAIEPQEYCCNYLKTKFKNKIEIIQMGLDSSEGIQEFFIANHHAASSFSKDWVTKILPNKFNDVVLQKSIKIKTTTLDKLVQKYGIPDFCKIDVEGYELEVLKGLSKPIKIISFEFTFPELKEKAITCLQHLNSLGKIKCNYSENETMELSLINWIDLSEFIEIINSKKFLTSSHGDIYVSFVI